MQYEQTVVLSSLWSLLIQMELFNLTATFVAPPGAVSTMGKRPLVASAPLASRQRLMEQMQTVITAHLYKNLAFCMHRYTSTDKYIIFCCMVLIAGTKGPAAASRFEAAQNRQADQY